MKVAIGVSPRNAASYDDGVERALRQSASDKHVCAIGSCGLAGPADDVQVSAFSRQVELAKELKLVLVAEASGAYDQALDIVLQAGMPPARVLLRAFDGTTEELAKWVDAGCYVSFDARAADDPVAACALAELVPSNRLLVESGAPHVQVSALAGFPARPDQVVFAADAIISLCPAPQLFMNSLDLFGL